MNDPNQIMEEIKLLSNRITIDFIFTVLLMGFLAIMIVYAVSVSVGNTMER